jgi:hypothetical protein
MKRMTIFLNLMGWVLFLLHLPQKPYGSIQQVKTTPSTDSCNNARIKCNEHYSYSFHYRNSVLTNVVSLGFTTLLSMWMTHKFTWIYFGVRTDTKVFRNHNQLMIFHTLIILYSCYTILLFSSLLFQYCENYSLPSLAIKRHYNQWHSIFGLIDRMWLVVSWHKTEVKNNVGVGNCSTLSRFSNWKSYTKC